MKPWQGNNNWKDSLRGASPTKPVWERRTYIDDEDEDDDKEEEEEEDLKMAMMTEMMTVL